MVVFYDKPYMKFDRLLETYHAFVPGGLVSYLSAIPVWIKEKLFTKKIIYDEPGPLHQSIISIRFSSTISGLIFFIQLK